MNGKAVTLVLMPSMEIVFDRAAKDKLGFLPLFDFWWKANTCEKFVCFCNFFQEIGVRCESIQICTGFKDTILFFDFFSFH